MGVDFVKRAARSFHKGLDRRRIELATPTLFTQQPTSAPRTYAANFCHGKMVQLGETLGVRLEGQQVLATRGLDTVATINRPTTELIEALSIGHGEACGVVQQVHELAGVAEISVC